MGIRSKARALGSLSWGDRGLVVEAALMLGVARATLLVIPFRRFRPWLTLARRGKADPVLVTRVRRAIGIAARNLPFEAVCLPQAMAGKAMLARRGAASAVCIGVGRDADDAMLMHAWLEAGDTIVTGAPARPVVTEITRFS
jgi:hypothetical protein